MRNLILIILCWVNFIPVTSAQISPKSRLFFSSQIYNQRINHDDKLIMYIPGIYDHLDTSNLTGIDISLMLNDYDFSDIEPHRIYESIEIDQIKYDKDLLEFRFDASIDQERLEKINDLPLKTKVFVSLINTDSTHSFNQFKGFVNLVNITGKSSKIRYTAGIIGYGFLCLFLLIIIPLKSSILRNNGNPSATYSLSRSILFWWTIIIFFSLLFLYTATLEINFFNETTWILLGIGSGTSTITAFSSGSTGKSKDPDEKKFKTIKFFRDIVRGQSKQATIPRLQSILFNLVFGVVFIIAVITDLKLLNFDSNTLILLGVSNSAYAILRQKEKPKD